MSLNGGDIWQKVARIIFDTNERSLLFVSTKKGHG